MSKKLINKEKCGFTLIEMIIVFAIFFVLGGAIFATLTMGRKSWQTGNVQVEVQQEVRKAMNSMIKELRHTESSRVTVTATPPTVTFSDPQSVDVNGNITWSGDIVYSLSVGQLLRTEGGVPDRVLANNIQSFIPNIAGEEITITITAQKNTIFRPVTDPLTASLTSQVTLRN